MLRAIVTLVLVLGLGGIAATQTIGTCNGFINLDYPSLADPPFPACVSPDPEQHCMPDLSSGQCDCCIDTNNTVTVSAGLGAGEILFGNQLELSILGFDGDCQAFVNPICIPRPGPPRIAWVGDSSITTDCGVAFTTGIPDNTPLSSPATILLTAVPAPLVIPENSPTPPGFCTLSFPIRIIAQPADAIFQLVRYEVGFCNNGNLVSGGRQTAKIQVCPEQPAFDCYQIPRGRIPAEAVTVLDQFGDFSATVTNLHRLCPPSQIDGVPPIVDFQRIHLAAYDVPAGISGSVNHQQVTVTTVLGNQGFTVTGTVGALKFIDLPTEKSLVSLPPAPPVGVVPTLACYRLNNVKLLSPAPMLTTTDQFAVTPLKVDKAGPFNLCVATSLNGGPTTGQPQTLLCNHTDELVSFGQAFPFITNAFESKQVMITQYDEVCAPAVIQ